MKNIKSYTLFALMTMGMAISCKDEDIVLIPDWETGVHGNAVVAEGSESSFIFKSPEEDVTVELAWISLDNKLTVEKIDVYVAFNEGYIDSEGNPKVARHGGDEGVLFATYEGSEVPGNREPVTFTLSQANLFSLYQDAQFDYDNGAGEVSVFNNPAKPDRDDFNLFIPGDAVSIRWEFTTTDGRVFNKWGTSVCTELPDAACTVEFDVICTQVIANRTGDWTITMTDSYGDGWNGAALKMNIDGVATSYALDDPGSPYSPQSETIVVAVPAGSSTLTFDFVSGEYDSEVTFTIVSPAGNTIAKKGPSPAKGRVIVDLCNE